MRPLINLLTQTTIQCIERTLCCDILAGWFKKKKIWNSWDKPTSVKNIIIEGKFESTLL